MRRKITKWVIVLIVLGLSLWIGLKITNQKFDMKSADYYAFSANYKQDQNCEWGRKAAIYEGQIYYSDPANGGIFRMGLDDGQGQQVINAPDIRKLQLSNKGVYYLGLDGSVRNEYRWFQLFSFDWVTEEIQNLTETSAYSLVFEAHKNLWDFYVAEDGVIANVVVDNMMPHTYINAVLYCTSPKEVIPCGKLTMLRDFSLNRQKNVPGSNYPEFCSIAAYGQLLFSVESFDTRMKYELAFEEFSVTDRQKNQLVLDIGLFMRDLHQPVGHRTINSFLSDGVLVHIGNEMMLMTSDFQDSVRSVLLDEEDFIRFVVVSEGNAYIIAERGVPDKQQSVYKLDLETFAYQKLYTCAKHEQFLMFQKQEEEKVVWLDAEKLVTAQGKAIRIWVLENGEYQLNRTVETTQNVVAKINKTDVAGDWLFVYQFNEKQNRDELIEKLSIAVE